MKRVFALLLMLPLLGMQQGKPHRFIASAGGLSCSPMTDSFSASLGTALNASYWTNVTADQLNSGTIVQNSGVAQASGTQEQAGEIVTGCTASATAPYAQFIPQTNLTDYLGLLILEDRSGNGYLIWFEPSGAASLAKMAAGSPALEAWTTNTCGNVTYGSTVVRFSAVVTTSAALTMSYNGTPCATWTDSSSPYLSGSDGLFIGTLASTQAAAIQAASFQAD
jgi:hypothetical protein